MKISIITVSFNSGRTIRDTIASVLRQTYPDLEYIVVDGASKDGTLDIVRSFGRRVDQCISEKDSGIYNAMNKGLRAAHGDVIGFLNSDDRFADDRIVEEIAAVFQSTGCQATYGDMRFVSAANPSKTLRYWKSGHFRSGKLAFGWQPPHPTLYMLKSVYESIGSYDESLRIAADYDLMIRFLRGDGPRVEYIHRVQVIMSAGGESNGTMKGISLKMREDLTVLRRYGMGWGTLAMKNIRKIGQLIPGRRQSL